MIIVPADIVTGALVNAIALAGRKISELVVDLTKSEELTTVRWFETFRFTEVVPEQDDLTPGSRDHLIEILNGDEIQAALQELLAARLTDAPETDASRARNAIRLTLSIADPDTTQYAEKLAAYYDDEICTLVARLEAEEPPLLSQIRSEAFSTRTINILNAIERHTAALISRPDHRTETSFLSSYRRHVIDQHGKLEPPDFERRRRVPISSIYVPTIVSPELSGHTEDPQPTRTFIDVFLLAERIDRSVLLGDPGGGKTTAANVLMHHFASSVTASIPFLVTVRDFAIQDPPERSVVGYIEHILQTLYQCPAPPGLVDFLLLTGRAVVIFDGLDELLDTSRRANVTTRVERFCTEYPLAPVLVTSRLVGYDQARLDDSQFFCYRLGGFGHEQVAEYVRKWFTQDAEARPEDVAAFLDESNSIRDLRSNPLLLSLLCILYRGAGSLPRNRAEVYEQCATLLFRKWDARRRIHQDLRAGHLLEPALRHLAWWLFTKDDAQAVTERALIMATTEFLYGRGFESVDDAREAAREFVEFCRGRMWVFSDAGSSVTGERLYAFTHRTFLEYFAAAQLAYDCDSPELLASSLIPRVARNEWWVVAELALQLKDRTSNGGAQRIYAAMLSVSDQPTQSHANLLRFLAQCLRSVDPSPAYVRRLTREILEFAFTEHDISSFETLISFCGAYSSIVMKEIDGVAADMLSVTDRVVLAESVKFLISMLQIASITGVGIDAIPANPERDNWGPFADDSLQKYAAAEIVAAEIDEYTRNVALFFGVMTLKQALKMPGGLNFLFARPASYFPDWSRVSYIRIVYTNILKGWPSFTSANSIADLEAIGEYLCDHPELPWFAGETGTVEEFVRPDNTTVEPASFGSIAYLGASAVLLISFEANEKEKSQRMVMNLDRGRFGPLGLLVPYLRQRLHPETGQELPELPIPDEFKKIFLGWAKGQVNTGSHTDSGLESNPQ
jgi:hypothetical protein